MTTTKVTNAIGARLTRNWLKDRSVAPAMMMFGGSPISVAVPPMFDAITSITIRGIGSMSSASASRKVIGTISRIVVRLSRKAERRAVVTASDEHDAKRLAARELAGPDRDVVIDARLLGQVDQDHHPREQADGVEVDRFDRGFLVVFAADEQDDDRGARKRDLGAMDALGRDQREREQECSDGDSHGACLADQTSRRSAASVSAEVRSPGADEPPSTGGTITVVRIDMPTMAAKSPDR